MARNPRLSDERESITCPRCGMTSYHPTDIREGYCGNCHDWTTWHPLPPGTSATAHLTASEDRARAAVARLADELGGYSTKNQAEILRGDYSHVSDEDVPILKAAIKAAREAADAVREEFIRAAREAADAI